MDVLIGFAGTVLGAALTLGSNWFIRRWDRDDRQRDTLIARAEELAGFASEISNWQVQCFNSALSGKNELPPWSLFRWQLLVAVYLPEVEPAAREVHARIAQVQDACAALATVVRRQRDIQPPQESIVAVKEAMQSLAGACVTLTDAVSQQIKAIRR